MRSCRILDGTILDGKARVPPIYPQRAAPPCMAFMSPSAASLLFHFASDPGMAVHRDRRHHAREVARRQRNYCVCRPVWRWWWWRWWWTNSKTNLPNSIDAHTSSPRLTLADSVHYAPTAPTASTAPTARLPIHHRHLLLSPYTPPTCTAWYSHSG